MSDELEDEEIAEEETVIAGADEQAAPATVSPQGGAPANPLASDPYDFDQCTITLQIVLLPDDDNEHGRNVVIAVRNHQDAPVIRSFRMDQVALGQTLTDMLDDLRNVLTARAMDKVMKDTKIKKEKKKPAVVVQPEKPKETTIHAEQQSLFA
jgi:hypothetical protein